MRITKISVKKLFGVFDHEIPLNQESRITIIHGPNGVGKTVLMRLLHGLFNCEYYYVAVDTPFEQIQLEFENGAFLTAEPINLDYDRTRTTVTGHEWNRGLRICFNDGTSPQSDFTLAIPFDHDEFRKSQLVGFPKFADGHIFEFFTQVETGEDTLWRADNWLFTTEALLDAIPSLHDAVFGNIPEWSGSIRQKINTSLIQTNRVNTVNTKGWIDFGHHYEHAEDRGLGLGSAISAITESIKAIPKREPIVSNRDRIEAVLATATTGFDTENLTLERYVESTDWNEDVARLFAKRRSRFISSRQQQELFEKIINERFTFKSFEVDAEIGLRFVSDLGKQIDCRNMSSGEQHLIILYYQLIFETRPDTLVMIDEPELSMHVDWQENFLNDMQQIVELNQFDLLIATHSPTLIDDKWEWTVRLGYPGSELQ